MLLYINPTVERLKIWECNMNIASKFKVGDVVHVLNSKNRAGCMCVAIATISEIHDDHVKLNKIKFFTGNVVMKATSNETTPGTISEIPFSRLSKISGNEPLMDIYYLG